VEKTFADGCKIAKFVKVFSLESFPLYGTCPFTISVHVHICLLLDIGLLTIIIYWTISFRRDNCLCALQAIVKDTNIQKDW
jgi:hypothetical protein